MVSDHSQFTINYSQQFLAYYIQRSISNHLQKDIDILKDLTIALLIGIPSSHKIEARSNAEVLSQSMNSRKIEDRR